MTIIVNGEPRKTSYVARVYPLTDNEEDIARMQGVRVVASDGNPVTVEIMNITQEEKARMRQGTSGWCYIDVIGRLEEQIDGPMVSQAERVDFTYWLDPLPEKQGE